MACIRPVLAITLVTSMGVSIVHAKECSRLVTAEMRENALANVARYDWAAKQQKAAVSAARPWAELSDDELWNLVPSQELPRAIHTNKEVGCPNCGKGIVPFGNYPWKLDPWKHPWKLTCPNCGAVVPKNDFGAFYKSALDERGMFRKDLGDRSLLFNAEHPDPDDPLHKLYVDDGYGMIDENGNRDTMIAYYVHWAQWNNLIFAGLKNLARAYTLTGDPRYAHKAAVLLDRIADVYPEMDYAGQKQLGFQWDHVRPGRIQNWTWECCNGEDMARAYDLIYDGIKGDEELARFCSRKAARRGAGEKNSVAAVCAHIEQNLLLEILKSVEDGRIRGNTGMHQMTLAVAAIALDRPGETRRWLDRLFDPEFEDPVPMVLVEKIDRDGMGDESGNYGLSWSRNFIRLAETLALYPEYASHDLAKEYPKLKQCFLVQARLNCLDAVNPCIGDFGRAGRWGRDGDVATFLRGFALYGDPRMATLAWHYANGDRERLRGDIFQKEPMAQAGRIAELARSNPFRLKCDHLGRYGLAILQTEERSNGRALWMHYGYARGHAHADPLNLGLYAKNVDMLPDLGYPEYTGQWPKRHAWTANTISHNTLVINDRKARRGGRLNLFCVRPPLRLFDASSRTAYGEVKTYRRTSALIDVSGDDSYVFDVFRARGGRNHRLSWHSLAQTAALEGVRLTRQAKGTFAGEDVEFAEFYDGQPGSGYQGSGFMYLYDVERSKGPVVNPFTVDWKIEDTQGRIADGHEPHLRLHSLSPCDEVALASGDPPQNKSRVLRRLRYLILSRLGEKLESQFVTVLEPYDTRPFIRSVRRLDATHDAGPISVVAVAVEMVDGTTDVLISCEEPTRVSVEGGIELDGQFGMVRLSGGAVKCMRMSNARLLRAGDVTLTSPLAAYEGKVTRVDATNPEDNRVFLEPPLPRNTALVGTTIHFENALPWDTSYDIRAVGEGWISTGDITLIRGFKDPKRFDAGYKYLVNPGDRYILPVHSGLDR